MIRRVKIQMFESEQPETALVAIGEKVKNEYKSGSGAKKIDIDLGIGEVNIIQ